MVDWKMLRQLEKMQLSNTLTMTSYMYLYL